MAGIGNEAHESLKLALSPPPPFAGRQASGPGISRCTEEFTLPAASGFPGPEHLLGALMLADSAPGEKWQ